MLALGALAATGACSGDGGADDATAVVTREDWAARAAAVCAHADARAGVAFGELTDEALRDALVGIAHDQMDDLRALPAPAEVRADVDALVASTSAAVNRFAALALHELDDPATGALFTDVDERAEALGVRECGVGEDAEPAAAVPPTPAVELVGLDDGDEVAAPLRLTMVARGFAVEPAGAVRAGAGHLHVLVDVPCAAPGATIPADDAHRHFDGGQTGATLDLPAGRHTLCLQAADGEHRALGLTDEVAVVVVGGSG